MNTKYQLGPSTNIFGTPLPDGTVFPNHIEAVDDRPYEFLEWFDLRRDKPWAECRFLDLGCSEGHTTLLLGQVGAQILGVEGRADAVERAKFLRDHNDMPNVDFQAENVADPSGFGDFDAVFAAGILYHLADPFAFIDALARHSRSMIYLCTHVAPESQAELLQSPRFNGFLSEPFTHVHQGREYVVRNFAEPSDTMEVTELGRRHPRSGVGNSVSVWLTLDSLVSLLAANGFDQICVRAFDPADLRVRLIAYRKQEIDLPKRLPAIPSFEDAVQKAFGHDLAFLRTNPGRIVVAGEGRYLDEVARFLLAQGVTLTGVLTRDPLPPLALKEIPRLSLEQYVASKPEFLVLATPDYRAAYERTMLLNSSRYLFTSFAQTIEIFGELLAGMAGR